MAGNNSAALQQASMGGLSQGRKVHSVRILDRLELGSRFLSYSLTPGSFESARPCLIPGEIPARRMTGGCRFPFFSLCFLCVNVSKDVCSRHSRSGSESRSLLRITVMHVAAFVRYSVSRRFIPIIARL